MKPVNLTTNPFSLLNDTWGLISCGEKDKFNQMTISWGSMGILWNKNIFNTYVRKSRYTYDFLQENETFTVTFFPEDYRKDLLYLGTVSGRDEDKLKNTSLHPLFLEDSISYEEAELTFVCKKLYTSEIILEQMPEEVKKQFYEGETTHVLFCGEIISVYQKNIKIYG